MNFLAHIHLAEPNCESRIGNLLGDFVRGLPWDSRFEPVVWKAIMEHRYVDAFTDAHPVWQRSKDLLRPEMRRFAGIVVDIFYDHFLSTNWSLFSPDQNLDEFIVEVHRDLRTSMPLVPEDAAPVIDAMIRESWLSNYLATEGIEETLVRVSHRSPRLHLIRKSGEDFHRHYETFEKDFLEFYPELIAYVSGLREEELNDDSA